MYRKLKEFTDALAAEGLIVSSNVSEADQETEIRVLTYNSKNAAEGTLFVCKGAHFRKQYLEDAVEAGAVAYISETDYELDGVPAIIVNDIRRTMSAAACVFYGKLSDRLNMIGITGTKGKSSTTYFIRQILDDYMEATGGRRTAVCSGIDNYDGVIEEESHLTTPETLELFEHMNNAVNSGITYMTMEVSSQALKYGRVDGIDYKVGCFLNIGTDHISPIEHPDFEDYLNSKLKIFAQCERACVNLDCEAQEQIRTAASKCPDVITFSRKDENADVYGYNIVSDEGKVSLNIRSRNIAGADDYDEAFELAAFGTINVENAIAAAAVCTAAGVPVEFIKSGLAKAVAPGRMEVMRSDDGKKLALIDYAHNKLSYEVLFGTLAKEFPSKKFVLVFGCPGMKALGRREELGTIAGKSCEWSIITEEDHGEEDVTKICEEIAVHVKAAGGKYEIIVDREQAVKRAFELADENTIVILAAKGRETRMKRGIEYIDFPSDIELAEKYINC